MFKWLTKDGARRGVHTSEFLVTVLGVLANVLLAIGDLISSGKAVTWSSILVAVYIASRGATKIGLGNAEDRTFSRVPGS